MALMNQAECDIWIFRMVEDVRNFPGDVLSEAELGRARRYLDPDKRRQFLVTRGFGRWIAAHELLCSPREIQWPITGAPRLTTPSGAAPLTFSVSHSGETSAIAIGHPAISIGLDLEEASVPLNVSAIARIALHPDEQEFLNDAEPAQRETRLRRLWTAKEAVLKAGGDLEQRSLLDVRLSLSEAAPGATLQGQNLGTDFACHLFPFEQDAGQFTAVSLHSPGENLSSPRRVVGTLCCGTEEPLSGSPELAATGWLPQLWNDHKQNIREELRHFGVESTVVKYRATGKLP
ncbi:4'-phosphopantetheinyl transferase family protein [Planctomicrobium sp. SH664]|uniref:4'-phosphopantetheinyl transferase family protein n=1 Tax=Planctomicrobium sp. SH664 TaxID=3448125 RepID=UPI003F5C8510